MSETASTRSKTMTESIDSESTESSLVYDRWTNNISYRQLVVSACIGIFQVWWHPYLHDFRRLLPFIFLYNIFSVFIGYPLFYLELALGVATKKSVLNCWDIAPMSRGIGFAMLSTCVFSALATGGVGAWCLALTVHSVHTFLPWLHCAADAQPPCAARHRPLPAGSETPPQSFFYNFVLDLKRDGLVGGLGNVVWELLIYYVICWILIYFIVFKRMYSFSKFVSQLVMFKDVLTYFVLVCVGVGAVQLKGATRMFSDCDWSVLFENLQIWREAMEYSLIEMTVCQGSLIMLGSYCPKVQHKLGTTAMLAFAVSKSSCMTAALVLGATHGALYKDYENSTNIWPGASSSMILWSDFVARIPGSQFWSALIFFTMFVLALTTTALSVQTIMSAFTGHSIRKITWAFLIVICVLFCLIGTITLCTQGGLYVVNFLINWPASKPRVPIAALIATVVTYVYGQTTFCEDVYLSVGEYPSVFMRICWALSPALMMCVFAGGVATWETSEAMAGWLLLGVAMIPIVLVMLLYAMFQCRVRNIVRDEK
ncbi:sodium-dependent neutral amino acid transporter B(0)AT3-like isoform X1 [Spodoptera frugiperda]|uniref:SFRICE_003114 n=1 Tax=Spodoptera frugiperda TaxID=7108 RepID=A0A2H1WZW3_SPOFR|nr:sodium-dependent neutral amino acid transporter B(0)AT3-like isoform X1 [Spodoptera frugiperda]